MDSSVAMLVKDGNDRVAPNSLCDLLVHAYFFEPSNFAVVTMLQSGLLDDLVEGLQGDDEAQVEARHIALLQVLASILFPKPLPKMMRTPAEGSKAAIKLAPLPDKIRTHLDQYNAMVLRRYSSFMRRYARLTSDAAREDLPGVVASDAFTVHDGGDAAPGSVAETLAKCSVQTVARSAFLSVSGHGDDFSSTTDLVGSMRDGVYLDPSLIPVTIDTARGYNAFIVDFYLNPERAPLSQQNGLRDAGLYDTLNQFCHAVRVLRNALERRIGDLENGDKRIITRQQMLYEAIESLEASFTEKFKAVFAFTTV